MLLPGLFDDDPHVIQPRALLGIKQIKGVDLTVLGRTQISVTTPSDLGTYVTNGSPIFVYSDGADRAATFPVGELGAQEVLTITERDRYRYPNNLEQILEEWARKRVDYLWWYSIFRSRGTPTEGNFPGLPDSLMGTKNINNGIGVVDLDKLQEARSKITTNASLNVIAIMSAPSYNAVMNAMRPNGESRPAEIPVLNDAGEVIHHDVPTFDGVPLTICSFVPDGEVWFIDPAAVYGITPANGTKVNVVRENQLDGASTYRIAALFTVGLCVQQLGGVSKLYGFTV